VPQAELSASIAINDIDARAGQRAGIVNVSSVTGQLFVVDGGNCLQERKTSIEPAAVSSLQKAA
jgi:hypothetical protein